MSATLCTHEVARAFHAGMHGTTFGGGPLACAVATAFVDHMEKENIMAHVAETGEYFQQQLHALSKKHACITDVRGKGLMVALELCSAPLGKLAVTELLKKHIVINCTSDTVLRFLPPFIFQHEHVDKVIAKLDEFFTENAGLAKAAAPKGEAQHG
jgi:acetylornithine/N-succinyldiaminopimelate aminotransferase